MESRSGGHNLFRIVLALAFISFGIIALGNNLHWWNIDDLFLEWWPLILVLIGIISILTPGGSWGGGIFLIFLGILFLLHSHGIYDIEDLIWPALLIMIGVMAWPRKRRKAPNPDPNQSGNSASFHATNADHVFNINTLFNSQKEIIRDEQLAGGHGTAVLGNLELDLRQSSPKSGAYLEFTAVFGNITLIVPADWNIVKHGGPVLGKVNDHRNASTGLNDEKKVTMEMNAIFGSIDVFN